MAQWRIPNSPYAEMLCPFKGICKSRLRPVPGTAVFADAVTRAGFAISWRSPRLPRDRRDPPYSEHCLSIALACLFPTTAF